MRHRRKGHAISTKLSRVNSGNAGRKRPTIGLEKGFIFGRLENGGN